MNQTEPTAFDRKVNELCRIQKEISAHLARLNVLKCSYMDWFNRKHQSFLDAVKGVQVITPQLMPKRISSIRHYKMTLAMGRKVVNSGHVRMGVLTKMEDFLEFWERLQVLKEENDSLYEKIDIFCNSISRLREPEIKDEIDILQKKLSLAFSEDWEFINVSNEKDNLFTYKVSISDQDFLGLVSYIPYLLTYATKLCFLCGKLFVERE